MINRNNNETNIHFDLSENNDYNENENYTDNSMNFNSVALSNL